MEDSKQMDQSLVLAQTMQGNYDDFHKDYDFEDKEEIAQKNKKSVFKMKHNKTNQYHAMKILLFEKELSKQQIFGICNMMQVEHSNMIPYYYFYYFQDAETKLYQASISMEIQLISLADEISRRKTLKTCANFQDGDLLNIIKSCLDVLVYLDKEHSASMFGLKPHNIFLCKNNVYKLADIGMQSMGKKGQNVVSLDLNELAESTYCAPEILEATKNQKTTVKINPKKADIFTIGLIIVRCIGLYPDQDMQGCNQNKEQAEAKLNNLIKNKVGLKGKYWQDMLTQATLFDRDQRCDFSKFVNLVSCGKVYEGKDRTESKDK